MTQTTLGEHRYRLIAFDWDGTAVASRAEHPAALAAAMGDVLAAGIPLAVITGTNAGNVSGQIAPLLAPAALENLYLLVNRGSEVYAHDAGGELRLLWRREATADENAALDRTAAAVQAELRDRHGIEVGIVSDRLNRRKIDLIPEPEWADPPKARIGDLLQAVEQRLARLPGGIAAAIDLAARCAREQGLPDARITSDVKHVEVGLTDKSDSIAFVMQRLAPMRGIRPGEVLLVGDEFGEIAGFEGSDYRMVTQLAHGATVVSVGPEPNGVPSGVIRVGGGPPAFVDLLRRQAQLDRPQVPARETGRAPAAPPTGDGWRVVQTGYDLVTEASHDALFALSNGYMGVRGASDEPSPAATPSAHVAGLYDASDHGAEDMLVIPDWATSAISVGGRALAPWEWTVVSHRRVLDLTAMLLERELVCDDPDGRRVRLRSTRLVSLAEHHLAGIRLELTIEHGGSAAVALEAGARLPQPAGDLPRVEMVAAGHRDGTDLLHTRTPGARVAVDVAQVLQARTGAEPLTCGHIATDDFAGRLVEAVLEPGDTLTVDRFLAVYTERDQRMPARAAADAASAAAAGGWERLVSAHRGAWAERWSNADIAIDGDGETQLGVRYATAQLIAAAPPAESRASIGAKGLTGPGYKGHVFWDTDVYLMPFYSLVMPEVARRIIEYRVASLPAARRHAKAAGLEGAWIAWESAASGDDVTPDYVVGPGGRRMRVLTGSQEIHVVADVAWAVDAYVRATGDERILQEGGGELVVEAARFFATRGVLTERGYEIHTVIGPDELHEAVDNSAFTNVMAAWTLRYAAGLAAGGVVEVRDGEPDRWRDLADRMFVARSPDGLIEQHDGFLSLPEPGGGPRDGNEMAWQRDRMEWRDVKQADVVMLMSLLEPWFTDAERLAHYRLYEPLTRHLSSLSEGMHSLVARRAELDDEADAYLTRAIGIDLHDSRGNRPDGIHMATQGGIWQAVIAGCGGVRAEADRLRLDPRLPAGWTRLRFCVAYRGTQVDVEITPQEVSLAARSGSAAVALAGFEGTVAAGAPVVLRRAENGWRLAA